MLRGTLAGQRIVYGDWFLMMPPERKRTSPEPLSYCFAVRKNDWIEPENPDLPKEKRYGLTYFNIYTGRVEFLSLYYTAADDEWRKQHGRPRVMQFKDIIRQRSVAVNVIQDLCTRPRIDGRPEYLDYLRLTGAIEE